MIIEQSIKKRFKRLPRLMKAKLKTSRMVVFDFDGVFTDNFVYIDDQGHEMVRCSRSDTFGLKELREHVEVLILSTEKNPIVMHRADKLKIPCVNDLPDKQAELIAQAKRHNIDLKNVIYVGNDENDLSCFEAAGMSIAVADAFPPVRAQADYVTKALGGNGAVREVIALLLLAKQ